MTDISKKYDISLIKTETSINKTGVKVYVGDDIEYKIEVLEEYNPITQKKIPMDLSSCKIKAIAYRNTSKTTIQQEFGVDAENDGKIEIISEASGIFKFKPNNFIMGCSDKIQVQFIIEGLEETISIQPMIFVVLESLDGKKEIIPGNEINTLRQLDEQLESSRSLIGQVENETTEMKNFVSNEIDSLNLKIKENDASIQNQLDIFNGKIEDSKIILDKKVSDNSLLIENQLSFFNTKISEQTTRLENEITIQATRLDSELDSVESRIDDLNIELTNATSFIPMQNFLTPFVKDGENYVSFKLTVQNYEAKKLAGNIMFVNINYESSKKQNGLSYTGMITNIYYEDSKAVPYSYMTLSTMYKPIISEMEIDPSVVFNGYVNKLEATEKYYEIWIKTRIPKADMDKARCILTVLGTRVG